MSDILTNITDIRRKKRIEISALANAINVSYKAYIKIETGQIPLSYYHLQEISKVFKMSITEIIDHETQEEKEKRVLELHKRTIENALDIACSLIIDKPFECKVLENYYREKFAKETIQTTTQS